MNRPITFLRDCVRQRDWPAALLAIAVLATAATALSIVFSNPMKVASLKRFHLGTENYSTWAVHQFVPSMYNFENKVAFSNLSHDLVVVDKHDHTFVTDTVNHFPARRITFGNLRKKQFGEIDQGTFRMVSSYGGQRLISTWKIETRDGVLWVTRVEQQLQETSAPNE